ncbi:Uncharacterised protein [Mycobacteroides abscessus]|nr:Uncharacterised protein [Mycobacteroides abscessus]
MKPLACTVPDAANATRPMPNVAIGYKPEAGSATRRSAIAPRKPDSRPIAEPASSSYTICTAVLFGSNTKGTMLNISTRITAGASLNPDSASNSPASRRGNGSTRSTEKTAAASVEDTMAPSSSASCQSMRSSTCAPNAVTTVLITTPTVANAPAGASTVRISANRVVKPPSTRITASAAVHTFRASSTLSNSRPSPSSPRTTPTRRKNSRLGNPMRVATLVPTMLASSTSPPMSKSRYSWCRLTSFPSVDSN